MIGSTGSQMRSERVSAGSDERFEAVPSRWTQLTGDVRRFVLKSGCSAAGRRDPCFASSRAGLYAAHLLRSAPIAGQVLE
jgi:hypothetical protein